MAPSTAKRFCYPFALSLSKGLSAEGWFDKLTTNGSSCDEAAGPKIDMSSSAFLAENQPRQPLQQPIRQHQTVACLALRLKTEQGKVSQVRRLIQPVL